MFLVPAPPFWTMPSPVPMSCNRKSLNGRIVLLPRAAGTVNAPRLITAPAGESGKRGRVADRAPYLRKQSSAVIDGGGDRAAAR